MGRTARRVWFVPLSGVSDGPGDSAAARVPRRLQRGFHAVQSTNFLAFALCWHCSLLSCSLVGAHLLRHVLAAVRPTVVCLRRQRRRRTWWRWRWRGRCRCRWRERRRGRRWRRPRVQPAAAGAAQAGTPAAGWASLCGGPPAPRVPRTGRGGDGGRLCCTARAHTQPRAAAVTAAAAATAAAAPPCGSPFTRVGRPRGQSRGRLLHRPSAGGRPRPPERGQPGRYGWCLPARGERILGVQCVGGRDGGGCGTRHRRTLGRLP